MALSDLEVFSEYAYDAMTETIDQQIHLFNEASRFAIRLETVRRQGDYSHTAFFKEIDALVQMRNPYVDEDVATVQLEHADHVGVKVGIGTKPVSIKKSDFNWLKQNPKQGGVVYGKQLAAAAIQTNLNSAISSVGAAISTIPALTHTVDTKVTREALAGGVAKFEDRWESIAIWVIHGAAIHDIFLSALQNNERLFHFGNVSVQDDGFGRPIIATNAPGLRLPNGKSKTLGLVTGAVTIEDQDDFESNVESNNGKTNIQRTIQSEWSVSVNIKGFAWDVANGGNAPTEAALATPENWTKVVTSDRSTAGVMVVSN
ncbi:MAG: hypothetical protein DSY80_08815 [Desulfocapsa sp.]|nr:MAG: hypothetical protein DSY80_08815 [Desulfocapsa sp.]